MDRFDDPKNYRQKRESFTRSLQHFHETRGTPFKKIPQFCGKEVDLFRLYNVVTQRGGWVKVNRTNQWDDILNEFHIPNGCVNGGNALKQIYLRYLDRYEKVHYLGESGDRHDLDEEDIETRHRRWSTRSIHTVPLTYNHHQHVVIDNLRKFNGLSTDIYKPSDYDRLALSLVSPLPNEQDFAINVCTLLSNEGKHTLKLEKCPRIVDFLLAHAGVYNHSNLRTLFEEVYGKIRGHSLSMFWSDVLESSELLDLTDERNFVKSVPRKYKFSRGGDGGGTLGTQSFGDYHGSHSCNADTESTNFNFSKNSRKCHSVPVVDVSSDLVDGETKGGDLTNVRTTDLDETLTNSIQDSLKPLEEHKLCKKDRCADDESIEGGEDSVSQTNKSDSNNILVSNLYKSELPEVTPLPVDGRSGNNEGVEATEVMTAETDQSNKSDSCLSNVCSSEFGKIKCDEQETPSVVSQDSVSTTPEVTKTENNFEEMAVDQKNSEEVALHEEEMEGGEVLMEEERIRLEREKTEEEERIRREAEEQKRLEEERLKAFEEAKKLEKQMKEAEYYEAMLKEAERKKRTFTWDETSGKRTKSPVRTNLKIDAEDLELFCLGRQNGTNDYVGQRILQVAHILRNLTFCDESMHVMAKNTTFIRFLLLCVNSKWSSLHQLGLDMLGNVSSELTIEDPSVDRVFQAFFWTVHRGIHHPNRFFVISCLEILNKICQKDENEDVVCRNVDQSVYDQVCRLLSLHDIMILLYTLECLYSMSSMGEKACTYICRSKGAIEMLLALITVEAQSYGPKACILMRVIETVSGTAASSAPTVQPPSAASPSPQAQMNSTMSQQSCSPQNVVSIPAPSTVTVQTTTIPKIITPTIIRAPSPKAIVGMPMAAVATPVQLSPTVCTSVVQTLPTVQQQHAHQQTVQENEQFALAWLRANFELSAGGKVEQQDVYRRYVDSCNKIGRKGIIASMHFPRFVRSVFGGTVGPKSKPIPPAEVKPGGPINQSVYEGIKVRDVPLTINIKLVPVTEVPRPVVKKRPQVSTPKPKGKRKKPESPTSPILKAQLVSPNKPISSSSPNPVSSLADGKVQVSTQTHAGQITLGQSSSSSPPCTPPPPMDNSTLIKSLLASKVSEICMTSPVGMLSDNPQVTQRQQQQQKILMQQQQQLQMKADATSIKSKVVRLNGIIQDFSSSTSTSTTASTSTSTSTSTSMSVSTSTSTSTSTDNHLVKGNKEPIPLPSGGGILRNSHRPKTPKLDGEDSDSMTSISATVGGGNISSADDNDNSLTSFEGIFNGVPESLDLERTASPAFKENCSSSKNNLDKKCGTPPGNESKPLPTKEENGGDNRGDNLCPGKQQQQQTDEKAMTPNSCVRQTQNKSLMLADLLDKKEGPALNGVLGKDLRIGEKGLELVEKAILKEAHLNHKGVNVKKDSVVSVNGESRTGSNSGCGGERSTVINNATPSPQCGSKRSTSCDPGQDPIEGKRLKKSDEVAEDKGKVEDFKISGGAMRKEKDKEEMNGEEEVRASSTAANLFAALAAEALEDETDFEVPSDPQPQTVVVPQGQIRPLYLGESSPLIVTASGTRQIIMTPSQLSQQGQVLISAGGQSLPVIVQNQRLVQGSSGQMLVASQPQQYIMSGNSQSQMLIAQPQTALVQGQPQTVLVAQAGPQQPGTKTIIILQPHSQGTTNSTQGKMMVTSQGTPMVVTSVARQVVQSQPNSPLAAPGSSSMVSTSTSRESTTTDVVLNSGVQNTPNLSSLQQNGSQIQIISSGMQNNAPILNQNGTNEKNKLTNGSIKVPSNSKQTDGSVYLCEWRGCMRSFTTANEVYMHVCNTHCPSNAEVETQCLWERCDGMKRKRFSLMTHLFDRHCNADALNIMAARRKQLSTQGRSEIPAPTPPPPHPGYAPNAAFHAIKRHALEFVNPKELLRVNGAKSSPPQLQQQQQQHQQVPTPPPPSAVLLAKVASSPVQVKDDNEGPVTKSIRLTASLILRNLVIYSSVGRRFLKGYEPHLASIALSNVESSRTIAQVLADLNDSSSR